MPWWLGVSKSIAKSAARKAAQSHKTWNKVQNEPKTIPIREAIEQLKEDTELSPQYIQSLISRVRYRDGVKEIMGYLKSEGASNLPPGTKTKLFMSCLDKLKYLDVMRQFLE